MPNFKRFALHFLNDWCTDDRRFVEGLCRDNDRSARRACLQEAAAYYKVSRTLNTLPDEERLDGALSAIDSVPRPIREDDVVRAVCGLAKTFQDKYGDYAISAASKFLWLCERWPIVIYDSRAIRCLNKSGKVRLRSGYYEPYLNEWRRQFRQYEEAIANACADVVRIKDYSFADCMPDDALAALTTNRWFRERVFDKYLWNNGGA